ncbi:hypothetical protein LXL04_008508 [Taraxacum kok-saghyz]
MFREKVISIFPLHELLTTVHGLHLQLTDNRSRMVYLMQFQRQGQNGLFHNGLHYVKGQLQSYQLPKQKHKNGSLLAGTLLAVSPVSPVMAPMGAAQSAAKELLDSILDAIVRIFDNYAVVGELLEPKSSQHAAMNTPKSMVATISGIPASEASKDTRGYTIGFSMTVL